MDALIAWLTDKGGPVAALAVALGLVTAVLGIARPVLQRRRERQAGLPDLQFANLRAEDPPPWSEAGKATFDLVNTGGGRAVMTDLRLTVVESGASETPKMVEAAAPVPVFTYKVTLEPGVASYDVRQREFGTEGPHAFAAQEVETVVVELRSRVPRWYRVTFVARWYDAKQPSAKRETSSDAVRVEFKPDVSDLLA